MDKKEPCACVCVRERQTAGNVGEMDSEEIGVEPVLFRLPGNFPCIKSKGTLNPIGNDTIHQSLL